MKDKILIDKEDFDHIQEILESVGWKINDKGEFQKSEGLAVDLLEFIQLYRNKYRGYKLGLYFDFKDRDRLNTLMGQMPKNKEELVKTWFTKDQFLNEGGK